MWLHCPEGTLLNKNHERRQGSVPHTACSPATAALGRPHGRARPRPRALRTGRFIVHITAIILFVVAATVAALVDGAHRRTRRGDTTAPRRGPRRSNTLRAVGGCRPGVGAFRPTSDRRVATAIPVAGRSGRSAAWPGCNGGRRSRSTTTNGRRFGRRHRLVVIGGRGRGRGGGWPPTATGTGQAPGALARRVGPRQGRPSPCRLLDTRRRREALMEPQHLGHEGG